ncbi:hypothetical protein [Nostoc sp.]|uniref:hypothetical protein n=1 Tax=Nostoc sp. TaxID=1180 RepID=UPI002FFA85F5
MPHHEDASGIDHARNNHALVRIQPGDRFQNQKFRILTASTANKVALFGPPVPCGFADKMKFEQRSYRDSKRWNSRIK